MSARQATLRIGIDTGGTFTDIVCVDDRSGSMHVTKVSSTPSNPAVALVRGVLVSATCGPQLALCSGGLRLNSRLD